jgi:antitoxin ChpS
MSRAESAKDLLVLPSNEDVERGLRRFGSAVRAHYGPRLVGLYLYGSRARGDHNPESDADVAAILTGDLDYWREVGTLSDLSYDELVDHGILIDAKPLALSDWISPGSHGDPSIVKAIKRDGKPIEFYA